MWLQAKKNNEFTATWTIGSANSFDAITATTVTPNAGEYNSLQEFTVAYTGFSGTLATPETPVAVTLANADDASVSFTTTDVTVNESNTGFTVKFAEAVTTPGNYTLTIPGGTVVSGTNMSPAIIRDYKILSDDPFDASYTLTPASGSNPTSLSTINVVYPNATTSFITTVAKATEATLTDGTNTYNATGVTINEDGKGFTVTFAEINKAGDYTLTIPEGTVTDGTNGNKEIKATYTIDNPFATSIVLDPADGNEVSSLKEIKVWFGNLYPNEITSTGDAAGCTLNDVQATSIALNGDYTDEIVITFPEITKAGTYTLTIPAGVASDGANSNEQITATYTIADPFAGATLTPADGKKLQSILEFSVTFPKALPTGTTFGEAKDVKIIDGDNIETPAARIFVYEDRTGYDVIFDQISEDGTYTVNIPAGFLKCGVNESAALQATYTIQKPTGVFANFTSDPAAGNWTPTYAYWANFTIEFPEITEFRNEAASIINSNAVFSGTGINGYMEKTVTLNKVTDSGITCLTVRGMLSISSTETPLTSLDGFYELTIPEGAIKLQDGTLSPEIIIPYVLGTATGIESVEASEDTVNVYDLTGRQLLKDADASELRTLANGLYIVNGKKVLLRR